VVKTGDSAGFEFMFAFVIASMLLGVVVAMRKKNA
ncbi:MAG: LPXTG cell wall anchor domain-containing protein, partial [Mogibacterium diversum]|nr:LPXTG cell wall anchor domain-containing protein [Mogibacterium diversum]